MLIGGNMSTGIWMTLVMPSTQINRQRTMMKYGCRNENVGIKKLYSDCDRPAKVIESVRMLHTAITWYQLRCPGSISISSSSVLLAMKKNGRGHYSRVRPLGIDLHGKMSRAHGPVPREG